MQFEISPASGRIRPRALSGHIDLDNSHKVDVSKADTAVRHHFPVRRQVQHPIAFARFPDPPHAPGVMELQRIGVTYRQRCCSLQGQRSLPAIHIAFGPEPCGSTRIAEAVRHIQQVGVLGNDITSAMLRTPSALTAGADSFDDHNHAASNAPADSSFFPLRLPFRKAPTQERRTSKA